MSVEFGADTSYGFSTSTQHSTAGSVVDVLVAGMKASTPYHMRARVEYDNGTSVTDADHTFTTSAVPPGLIPPVTASVTSGLTPQPGVELIDVLMGGTPSTAFATDTDGNVVWTYRIPDGQPGSTLYPIKLLPNGHFACMIAPTSTSALGGPVSPTDLNVFREIDLVGNTIRQVTMADLNTGLAAGGFNLTLQLFSHDFAILPNGHYLVIAAGTKQFTGLAGLPGTTNVLGDAVVDLDPDLKPVWAWNSFDHLDINRRPMGFPDWTHANDVTYSPDDGNFLISLRHQNWILKIDYRDGAGTGNIIWKLGDQGDFTLKNGVNPTDWSYAQHDPNFVSSNTTGTFSLAIMDNGNDRAFPSNVACNTAGNPPCQYTTIPVMQIDENAKTASFLFHQIIPASQYSSFAGSTRVLPNTNIEYNLAGVGKDSYTYEVTPTATPQTVWQMHIVGSNTYRAFRMPSLYPDVQW